MYVVMILLVLSYFIVGRSSKNDISSSLRIFREIHRRVTDGLLNGLILFIFFTSLWWWRPTWYVMDWSPFQNYFLSHIDTPQEDAIFYARFSVTTFICLLAVIWIFSGFKGAWTLLNDVRSLWLLTLLSLVAMARLSVGWATRNSDVAHSYSVQWLLVFVFVVIVTAVKPKPKHVVIALSMMLVINAVIALAQDAAQSDIGIREYGLRYGIGLAEFPLEPEQSGESVIQSRGVRYLRAYGINSHPNLLAAGLVLGLMASLSLWRRHRFFAAITVLGFWGLLLTFSRASIGGLAVGLSVTIALWWLLNYRNYKLVFRLFLTLLMTFGIFYIFYGDLINVRAGVGEEGFDATVETRSISDRQVYLEQARAIIGEHALKGVGIGNFPWESQLRIVNDPRQLALGGQNVHNSYLLALSELGAIGGLLFLFTLLTAGGIVLRNLRRDSLSVEASALAGGVAAWLAIGWFEFFWWSLLTHQVLFWGVIAVILIEEPNNGSDQTQRRMAISNLEQ
jgi:hypothetical protein